MDPKIKSRVVSELRRKIGRDAESGQATQQEVSEHSGVHQSQISRFVAGDFMRASPKLKAVCSYLDISLNSPSNKKSVKNNKILMTSLQRAWDGSDKHAIIISRLLDSVADSQGYMPKGR